MCRNVHWWLLGAGQVHKLYVASVSAGEGEKGVVTVGTQDTETYAETERTGWETTMAKACFLTTQTHLLLSNPQPQVNYLWSVSTLESVTDWKEHQG